MTTDYNHVDVIRGCVFAYFRGWIAEQQLTFELINTVRNLRRDRVVAKCYWRW